MTLLKALYRNEMEKLFYRKKYIVFLVLDVLICLLTAVGQILAEIVTQGAFRTMGFFDDMLLNGFSLYLTFFIPLIALMGCADLFSGEVHDRSLRMLLQRPVERWKLFLSKVMAVFSLCFIYILLHFVILFAVKLGFGQTAAGTLYGLAAYLLDLIPVFVVVTFFALIHQTVHSSGSAVALSLVVYLLLWAVSRYADVGNGLLFVDYICWHSIWLGNTLPLTVLLPKIGILLGSGVVLYCAGFELFDRKEL
ncbi:MAG: ABC transporter permease [Firmicutes bacterium]|nr:ABC transporter permease [Bacillota bacterium]